MTSKPAAYVFTHNCQNEPRMEASGHHSLGRSQMHILAILGALLGGGAIWYWRLKAARDVGSEVVDLLGRARGAYRMRSFRVKAEGSVLSTVDDPALAACILLCVLANESPHAAAHLVEAEVRRQVSQIAAADKLDEMMAYAAWVARGPVDASDCVRRFKNLWRANLTLVERRQLLHMAVAVRALTPGPAHGQKFAIETLEKALAH
jgi:hypothetical protein